VDAKSSIQARSRCCPTSPPARGRPVCVEHEYQRQGALALLAALDVRTGKVFASTPGHDRDQPVHEPDRPDHEHRTLRQRFPAFVIVDNGSGHRGRAAITRLAKAHPNAIMIHTPVQASWLNRSSSQSSRKRSSHPTTSPALATCPARCSPSLTVTLDRPAIPLELHRCRPGQIPRPGQRQQPATLLEAA
jgi:hypothetical protein